MNGEQKARLTDAEFAIVRGHPQHGFDALDTTGGIADDVKDVARHHHDVTAFHCLRSRRPVSPDILEVGTPASADTIVDLESNLKWRFRDLDRLWEGDHAQHARELRER